MRFAISLLTLLLIIGCGDDDKPTSSPGDDLVGTWVAVSSTDPEEATYLPGARMTYNDDGTFRQSITLEGIQLSIDGTWEIVGGKLLTIATVGEETQSFSESWTVRNDRLTLVDDEDGSVEVWERQS